MSTSISASMAMPILENFAELFEQSQPKKHLTPGSILMGQVMEIRPDMVIVNAGLKSEGVIPIEQFYNEHGQLEVAVGDTVDCGGSRRLPDLDLFRFLLQAFEQAAGFRKIMALPHASAGADFQQAIWIG